VCCLGLTINLKDKFFIYHSVITNIICVVTSLLHKNLLK
jgi:hypothetical protein